MGPVTDYQLTGELGDSALASPELREAEVPLQGAESVGKG
jgi:hypothetical protein